MKKTKYEIYQVYDGEDDIDKNHILTTEEFSEVLKFTQWVRNKNIDHWFVYWEYTWNEELREFYEDPEEQDELYRCGWDFPLSEVDIDNENSDNLIV